jgi:hypothetical protein
MKYRSVFGFVLALTAILIGGGTLLALQRAEMSALRNRLEVARSEAAERARLQEENRRLRERQISASELETLRSDHAALPRLRAELQALTKKPVPTGP